MIAWRSLWSKGVSKRSGRTLGQRTSFSRTGDEDKGCVQHTQIVKPTDSPSTQYIYSDGVHPVESIPIGPQYML